MLFRLEDIVRKVDGAVGVDSIFAVLMSNCGLSVVEIIPLAPLAEHLDGLSLTYSQFAFRWMNCLLMREIPLPVLLRVWDTYLSESESFGALHVFVCTAFLIHWSEELVELDFQVRT